MRDLRQYLSTYIDKEVHSSTGRTFVSSSINVRSPLSVKPARPTALKSIQQPHTRTHARVRLLSSSPRATGRKTKSPPGLILPDAPWLMSRTLGKRWAAPTIRRLESAITIWLAGFFRVTARQLLFVVGSRWTILSSLSSVLNVTRETSGQGLGSSPYHTPARNVSSITTTAEDDNREV